MLFFLWTKIKGRNEIIKHNERKADNRLQVADKNKCFKRMELIKEIFEKINKGLTEGSNDKSE